MIRRLFTSFLAIVLMAGSSAFAASTFTVTSSTSETATTFTVRRSGEGTNVAETVCYRAVSLSAIRGDHFSPAPASSRSPSDRNPKIGISSHEHHA